MSSIASSPTVGGPRPADHSIFRPFPIPQTGRQWFYLAFLQGVGAGFIDGGANFGIAYAMYSGQKSVKMWVFSESTIAGDLGVTPIIQCLASMLITSTLVHTDLHHNAIQPLPFVYPHVEHLPDPRILFDKIFNRKRLAAEKARAIEEKRDVAVADDETPKLSGVSYYYWMLVRFIFEGTEMNMMLARGIGVKQWFLRLLWTAGQGALIGIVFGFPLWCLAIVILGPIYKMDNMGNKWAPQVIKGVYGAIVGWVTNPVIASLALGSQADNHLIVIPDEEVAVEGAAGTEEEEAARARAGSVPLPIVPIPEDCEIELGATPVQSTFLRPDRSSTLSSSPIVSPRHRSSTIGSAVISSSPTRSRSGSVSRSRSGSVSRPPMLANVSYMECLPPTVPVTDVTTAGQTPARSTRPRGLTVSSHISTTGSTFSYALGGTGGRAKRPRANTSASTRTLPDIATIHNITHSQLSSTGHTPSPQTRIAPLPADGPPGAIHYSLPSTLGASARRASDLPEHPSNLAHRQAADESAAGDVFGPGPAITIQRPSMDIPDRSSMDQRRQ